jgi:flagella basal body P-ring formation protein FlgA
MLLLGLLLFGGVTVDLPAEAHVESTELTLGQVATVRGDDLEEVARVEGLTLGYAPSPGYSRVIERWKLIESAKGQLMGIQIEFKGEASCRVRPETAVVAGIELQAKAKQALETQFAGEDVKVRSLGVLDDEIVPRGTTTRELIALPTLASMTGGAGKGRAWTVPVRIVIDGMPYRTVWSTLEVDLFRLLPVLGRDVPKGDTIGPDDVVLKRTEIKSDAGFNPLTKEMLVGASAKRLLRKDEPVGARDVARQVAVKTGETIDLEIASGQVCVKTRVIALGDGYVGDIIPVQVLASGKQLTATVDRLRHVRLILNISG